MDSEGARLVLTELAAAYVRPYLDFASDIIPSDPPTFGDRVCLAMDGQGCLVCRGILDVAEAQLDLSGPESQRQHDAIYGIKRGALDRSGPSVVSINGVVASLGVTEFMLAVTGVRAPRPVLIYHGQRGIVFVLTDAPAPDCYYCSGLQGHGDAADVQRYIRAGIGAFLR